MTMKRYIFIFSLLGAALNAANAAPSHPNSREYLMAYQQLYDQTPLAKNMVVKSRVLNPVQASNQYISTLTDIVVIKKIIYEGREATYEAETYYPPGQYGDIRGRKKHQYTLYREEILSRELPNFAGIAPGMKIQGKQNSEQGKVLISFSDGTFLTDNPRVFPCSCAPFSEFRPDVLTYDGITKLFDKNDRPISLYDFRKLGFDSMSGYQEVDVFRADGVTRIDVPGETGLMNLLLKLPDIAPEAAAGDNYIKVITGDVILFAPYFQFISKDRKLAVVRSNTHRIEIVDISKRGEVIGSLAIDNDKTTVKIVGDELRINNRGQILVKSIANLSAANAGASAICEKILKLP